MNTRYFHFFFSPCSNGIQLVPPIDDRVQPLVQRIAQQGAEAGRGKDKAMPERVVLGVVVRRMPMFRRDQVHGQGDEAARHA